MGAKYKKIFSLNILITLPDYNFFNGIMLRYRIYGFIYL